MFATNDMIGLAMFVCSVAVVLAEFAHKVMF